MPVSLLYLPSSTLTLNMHVGQSGTPGSTTIYNSGSVAGNFVAAGTAGTDLLNVSPVSGSVSGLGSTALGAGWANVSSAGGRTGTISIFDTTTPSDSGGSQQTQNVVGGVYNYASGVVTAGGTINLGYLHLGASALSGVTVMNTAASGGYSESLDATVTNASAYISSSGTLNLLAATSSANNLGVGMANLGAAGFQSGLATINFVSDGSGSSNLGTTAAGTASVYVTATGYTGQANWTGVAGNTWNNFSNWDSGGVPGIAGTLSVGNDTATFGSSGGTVILSGTSPQITALSFINPAASYTIAAFSGETLHMNAGTGTATIAVSGGQTIAAQVALDTNTQVTVNNSGYALNLNGPVSGNGGLISSGGGRVNLYNPSGNSYGGGTTVGSLVVAGNNTGSATGSGSVQITSGGTLAGGVGYNSGNTAAIAGTVTVGSGGTIHPGTTVINGGTPASMTQTEVLAVNCAATERELHGGDRCGGQRQRRQRSGDQWQSEDPGGIDSLPRLCGGTEWRRAAQRRLEHYGLVEQFHGQCAQDHGQRVHHGALVDRPVQRQFLQPHRGRQYLQRYHLQQLHVLGGHGGGNGLDDGGLHQSGSQQFQRSQLRGMVAAL